MVIIGVSPVDTLFKFKYYFVDFYLLIIGTDPRNYTTHYTYDGLKSLTGEISPVRGALSYTYDAAGNLLTRNDARGSVHTTSYDELNRPILKTLTRDGICNPVPKLFNALPLS